MTAREAVQTYQFMMKEDGLLDGMLLTIVKVKYVVINVDVHTVSFIHLEKDRCIVK